MQSLFTVSSMMVYYWFLTIAYASRVPSLVLIHPKPCIVARQGFQTKYNLARPRKLAELQRRGRCLLRIERACGDTSRGQEWKEREKGTVCGSSQRRGKTFSTALGSAFMDLDLDQKRYRFPVDPGMKCEPPAFKDAPARALLLAGRAY
ncbi:hypothetical protein BDW67DRAFT_168516 [Aspergillus spinulosporus]